MNPVPDISVVIATRDRHASLARLLRCVRDQDLASFECIVVDDASSAETLARYDTVWAELDERFRLLLPHDGRKPQGPSAARNRGINAARGTFIAFCDDDDRWLRRDHLRVALDSLRRTKAELFFANMQTSRNGEIIGPDFYGVVRRFLTRWPAGDDALFDVPLRQRARAMKHIFMHCNSLVVSAALLKRSGAFWEKLSMAEDRELGLRLLDAAEKVLYRDVVVADYDRTVEAGLCKSHSEDEIRQFIILAMLRTETRMNSSAMCGVARGYRAWMLLELAQGATARGDIAQSRELAVQSLMLRPTMEAARLLLGTLTSGSRPARVSTTQGVEAR